MAHERNRKANIFKLTCLANIDHMDYRDFHTKHFSASKFKEQNVLPPLDVQSLCSDFCAFGSCCTKYATEKLQTPKVRYTSLTHSALVLHMLSNKPTIQLANQTVGKKSKKV